MHRKPIEIKISTVVAIAVILHDAQLSTLESALKELTANSSDYYSEECAVLDVGNIDCATMDWPALIQLFRSCGFHPVAVRNAPSESEEAISALGLSIDLASKTAAHLSEASEPQPEPVAPVVVAPVAAPLAAPVPMIIDTPVRGGQRIYARGTDLIITAVVNSGAEVIADGNIHIYAPLRGRALAGASGNINARIFTMSLEAELVSIAGIYRTFENGYPKLTANAPLQIKLDGDKIDVSSIQSAS
jgi:septum site-determining protein MinC